ncbi:hypothetical protein QMK33_19735 [Hymenobacter sp. H14-R3]|uniref:hypothetical protein n=1 Tax=Hymenobacter sp. H14-R3 TaxID=3046308 RepID=UPI0024BBAE7C|nr:hypothetical protein [Hymenobacter sp. H14-R3]MDJ0367386.1 hypothetical protein [Hymenobacter sp. H14-R3]
MQLIDLLNQLDQQGRLSQLYQAGALNIKCFNYKELVLHYRALLASPTYAEQPSRAAQATAAQCGVAKSTVYLAIREMEQMV